MPSNTQDPKYSIINGQLVTDATGVPIPIDEPVFIIRGKDTHAIAALASYRDTLRNPQHVEAVNDRLVHFMRFATENPDRMKEPDTAR